MSTEDSSFNRLQRLNPSFGFPSWCFESVISESQVKNYEFWLSKPTLQYDSYRVNLSKVIGTAHPYYPSKNWIEMLGKLNRCYPYYNYQYCKAYFEKDFNKSGLHFNKYGDDFIIAGGNNRTCIAKFIGIEYLQTMVVEYCFDNELFELITCYKNSGIHLEYVNLTRDGKITISLGENVLIIKDFELKKYFLLFYQSIIPSLVLDLKYSLSFKRVSNSRIFIKTKDDINALKQLIYLTKYR